MKLIATLALVVHAMAAPLAIHGSGDGFAAPGVKLAWGIARGANEAATSAVVRVVADTGKYPWLAVIGVDPFTKAEQVRLAPTALVASFDVSIPRASFADWPHTEFRFYGSEQDARAGNAALVVYYHGVPDTVPEFADRAKLSQYLDDRIAKLQ